jgi:hypothetical protein
MPQITNKMKTIEINPFEWVSFQFVIRARLHDDETAIILKGHLLIEYLLDRIIEEKVTTSKRLSKVNFSQKVKELSNRRLLLKSLEENIERVNHFRNKLVHQLDFSINQEDMLFTRESGEVMNVSLKKGRYPQRYYYRLLCGAIITQLTNHMLVNLKVDPRSFENANRT